MPPQFPSIPVLYEDDDLLFVDKPPGIVVNRSHTQKELTIQDWIEQRPGFSGSFAVAQDDIKSEKESIILGDPLELFKDRSGIVHRLDKDTSGVMLIAKNPSALIECMKQFKLRQVQKSYVALVHGKLQPQTGEINAPIGRHPKKRLQFAVVENGKQSVTEYRVIQYYPHIDQQKVLKEIEKRGKESLAFYTKGQHGLTKNFVHALKIYQGFSLIELNPKSGRTHQLRVHLSHLKHPIVGDIIYSNTKRRLIDEVWNARIFLHAKSLKIVHPRTKTELNVETQLTEDLNISLSFLSTQ